MALAMFVFYAISFIAATIVAVVSGFLTLAFLLVITLLSIWMCKDVINGSAERRQQEQWKKEVSSVTKHNDEELMIESNYAKQEN